MIQGFQGPMNDTASEAENKGYLVLTRHEIIFLITIIVIVASWLFNCIIIGGILQVIHKSKTIPGIYLSIASQSVAALLNTTLNIPAGIISTLLGTSLINSYTRIFCIFSVYLETFFCNLSFLHAFCAGLDSYIRLRRPKSYTQSSLRQSSIWLKITSPWIISSLQTILQMILSDKETAMLNFSTDPNNTSRFFHVCIIPESNFIIIRTSIAYIFPLIACLIITGMQLYALKNIPYLTNEEIVNLIKIKCRNPSLEVQSNQIYQCAQQLPQITFQDFRRDRYRSKLPQSISAYNFQHENERHLVEVKSQHLNYRYNLKPISERPPKVRPIWLQAYKLEQVTVGINMMTCIISIVSWSPLILSILSLILCSNTFSKDTKVKRNSCLIQSSAQIVGNFRWWNYITTGLLLPIILLLLDAELRRSCLKALVCWDSSKKVTIDQYQRTAEAFMANRDQFLGSKTPPPVMKKMSNIRPSKTLPEISKELEKTSNLQNDVVWLSKS